MIRLCLKSQKIELASGGTKRSDPVFATVKAQTVWR